MMKKFLQGIALVAIGLSLAVAQPAAAQVRGGWTGVTQLPANDDGSSGLVNIGFSINFFGVNYSQLYVNNNGNVSFNVPLGVFNPSAINLGSTPMLAPFLADVDTRGAGGLVEWGYKQGGAPPTGGVNSQDPFAINPRDAFGVTWLDVGHFDATGLSTGLPLNKFQLVIIDRGDVSPGDFDFEFNYAYMLWEAGEASGGDGLGLCDPNKVVACDPARVGWSNGVGSSFELAGSGVGGALIDGGPNALTANSMSPPGYPTLTSGRYLWAVRNGQVTGVVPEPMTFVLMGTGLIGIGLVQIRRRRQDAEV